jgi:hypothetical protein
MLCAQFYLQHTNSPRVGLDSHFSGGSVSFRDYTPLVKINMYAPDYGLGLCYLPQPSPSAESYPTSFNDFLMFHGSLFQYHKHVYH